MEAPSRATPAPASTRPPLAGLLWSLRRGWGLASCAWVPRGAGGEETASGRPPRARELDWSGLARLAPGETYRPDRRRSPRAAAALLDELWVAPSQGTATGVLRLVGEGRRLPSDAEALAAADRVDQLSRVLAANAPGPRTEDAAWAHDLRNRLTHALLGLERYRSESAGGGTPLDEVVENLQLARRACHGRLAEDEGAARETVALREVLLRAARSAAELASRKRHAPSARGDVRVLARCPSTIEIAADSTLLFRAVENLALNALQASRAGASVRIEGRVDGDLVSVVVTDRGRGMGPAELDAFRTPGVSGRRAEGGTGYGTASLFECLTRLGAELDLETIPGLGTTACIRLPRAAVRALPAKVQWSPWAPERLDDELCAAVRAGRVTHVHLPRGAVGPRAERIAELCRERGIETTSGSVLDPVRARRASDTPGAPRASDRLGAPRRAGASTGEARTAARAGDTRLPGEPGGRTKLSSSS